MISPKIIAAIVLLSLFAAEVQAIINDEVKLKNGDRLTGKIVAREGETITLETDYAGKVTIDAKFVDSVTVAEAKPAETETAEKAEAKAAETEKASKAVSTPLPKTAVAEKPVERNEPPRLFGGEMFGLFTGWEGNAAIGFNFTTGNSRTSQMTTGLRATKTGTKDKLTVYSRSLWNSNRNSSVSTTQNAVWGGARYDRRLSDRTFGFVSYDFERDRPRKLILRSVPGGGLGHHLIKNDRTELDVLVGGGWNRTWQVGPNTDTPEALAGNTLKHRFNGRLRLQQAFTFYQNVTDRNEFRFIFDSNMTVDITKKIGWQFTVGNRFNNDPTGTTRRNDFFFTTGMRWNFGKKN
jgi:putative salt-induced outer membrane protein